MLNVNVKSPILPWIVLVAPITPDSRDPSAFDVNFTQGNNNINYCSSKI